MNGNPFNDMHMGRKLFLTKRFILRAIECWRMEIERRVWREENAIICITQRKTKKCP